MTTRTTGTHRKPFRQRTTRCVSALWQLARAGQWHGFWTLFGDVLEELLDLGAAVLAVLLVLGAVIGAGAVVWAAAGPAVLAGLVALIVVAVGWWRLYRRRSRAAAGEETAPMSALTEAVAS